MALSRLRFTPGAEQVVHTRKGGHDASGPGEDETVDADEFVRVPVDEEGREIQAS